MPQIKDISILKTSAQDEDFLILQSPDGETYRITKADLFAGLSSGSGGITPSNSVSLDFSTSGDANGLFYYIGSNKKTQTWQNPQNAGIVLSSSSLGAGSVSLLCDRQEGQFYTNNEANGWVKIDIRGAKLKCNRYSLRNRNNTDYYLRSWKFQGSNDDINFVDLDVQVNNTVLNAPSQWLSLPVTTTVDYSIFRLLITGTDSMGYNFMCLGEIELYGLYTP